MSDAYRDLHGDAYREWRDKRADEFVEIQRRAFKAGFESAADESAEFRHLRMWLEEQRDDAKTQFYDGDGDDMMHARYLAFCEVLVKLHEMGNTPQTTDCEQEADQ